MGDLRDEVKDMEGDELEAWLQRLAEDWKSADLSPLDLELCVYADKLTRSPSEMQKEDIDRLRELGLTDFAIHDLIQVTAYFNYINRVADAVHVDLEEEMPPYPGG